MYNASHHAREDAAQYLDRALLDIHVERGEEVNFRTRALLLFGTETDSGKA